jgi:hypothetical protein
MRYLLLIASNEQEEGALPEKEEAEILAAYGTFTRELQAAGVMRGADRHRPTTTATTVRVRNGETLTTDGPFAETKEQFGGYYEIDVKDLDEAIQWAAKVPSARYGSVEVRPIWD